jgi:hypothetical protein
MGAATLLINIVRICGSLFRKRILLWSDFSFRTLLGLIIGFTCSMATGRYEQRKNYEEAEANAIGTEYVWADPRPCNANWLATIPRNVVIGV